MRGYDALVVVRPRYKAASTGVGGHEGGKSAGLKSSDYRWSLTAQS